MSTSNLGDHTNYKTLSSFCCYKEFDFNPLSSEIQYQFNKSEIKRETVYGIMCDTMDSCIPFLSIQKRSYKNFTPMIDSIRYFGQNTFRELIKNVLDKDYIYRFMEQYQYISNDDIFGTIMNAFELNKDLDKPDFTIMHRRIFKFFYKMELDQENAYRNCGGYCWEKVIYDKITLEYDPWASRHQVIWHWAYAIKHELIPLYSYCYVSERHIDNIPFENGVRMDIFDYINDTIKIVEEQHLIGRYNMIDPRFEEIRYAIQMLLHKNTLMSNKNIRSGLRSEAGALNLTAINDYLQFHVEQPGYFNLPTPGVINKIKSQFFGGQNPHVSTMLEKTKELPKMSKCHHLSSDNCDVFNCKGKLQLIDFNDFIVLIEDIKNMCVCRNCKRLKHNYIVNVCRLMKKSRDLYKKIFIGKEVYSCVNATHTFFNICELANNYVIGNLYLKKTRYSLKTVEQSYSIEGTQMHIQSLQFHKNMRTFLLNYGMRQDYEETPEVFHMESNVINRNALLPRCVKRQMYCQKISNTRINEKENEKYRVIQAKREKEKRLDTKEKKAKAKSLTQVRKFTLDKRTIMESKIDKLLKECQEEERVRKEQIKKIINETIERKKIHSNLLSKEETIIEKTNSLYLQLMEERNNEIIFENKLINKYTEDKDKLKNKAYEVTYSVEDEKEYYTRSRYMEQIIGSLAFPKNPIRQIDIKYGIQGKWDCLKKDIPRKRENREWLKENLIPSGNIEIIKKRFVEIFKCLKVAGLSHIPGTKLGSNFFETNRINELTKEYMDEINACHEGEFIDNVWHVSKEYDELLDKLQGCARYFIAYRFYERHMYEEWHAFLDSQSYIKGEYQCFKPKPDVIKNIEIIKEKTDLEKEIDKVKGIFDNMLPKTVEAKKEEKSNEKGKMPEYTPTDEQKESMKTFVEMKKQMRESKMKEKIIKEEPILKEKTTIIKKEEEIEHELPIHENIIYTNMLKERIYDATVKKNEDLLDEVELTHEEVQKIKDKTLIDAEKRIKRRKASGLRSTGTS
jgi:hypothetical protein